MVHVTDDNSAPSFLSYMEFTKIHIFFTFLIHNGKYMYHNLQHTKTLYFAIRVNLRLV
jgi:hypothetical protein